MNWNYQFQFTLHFFENVNFERCVRSLPSSNLNLFLVQKRPLSHSLLMHFTAVNKSEVLDI